jgi:23S rRNA (cytidine1920-2'-O)/16S rRNA (cytidine1409-2'-O)-methyltransferase
MKKRVDILLAEKGLTKSREKAKIQIISGNVYANGKQVKTLPIHWMKMQQSS